MAVGALRASGALDFGLEGIRWLVEALGWDTRFVDALPTALVKPFSGSAARAMLIETMQSQGVDSFPALVAATVQGSTETTFYVLAVYFGAVGIQRARISGVWLYWLIFAGTFIWAIWEVGLDPWSLLPRVLALAVIALLSLAFVPMLRRPVGREART